MLVYYWYEKKVKGTIFFLTNTSENAYLCIIKQFKMKENIFSANVYKLLVQKKILKCQVKD